MSYKERVTELEQQMINALIDLIPTFGEESKFIGENILNIEKEDDGYFAFNLGGSAHLVELGEDGLYDNYGHKWSFGALNLEQLAAIVDHYEAKE